LTDPSHASDMVQKQFQNLFVANVAIPSWKSAESFIFWTIPLEYFRQLVMGAKQFQGLFFVTPVFHYLTRVLTKNPNITEVPESPGRRIRQHYHVIRVQKLMK